MSIDNQFRKLFIRAIAGLLLAGLLNACDSFRKDDHELVDAARQYLEKRDVRAAAIELRNALKLNPQNADARYLLASINLQVGSASVAEAEFRKAGEMGAPEADVSIGLALALLEQNLVDELLDEVRVSDSWPAQAKASVLALRAAAENASGSTAAARESLATAAALMPDNEHVLVSTARLLISEEQDAQALEVLERAQSRYPENQEILFLKAGIAYKHNQTDEIKKTLYRIIEVDLPKIVTVYEWRARLGIAQILMDEGAIQESQAVLEPLMPNIQKDADSLYLAAVLAFKQGDREQAVRQLHKVLELNSDHRPALLLLGSVNYYLGEYEQAAYFLSKYIATVPDDMTARKLLGKTYLELDAHKELRDVLAPMLAGQKGDAEVVAMMGMSALRLGRLQAGVADIEKAVAMSPQDSRLRQYLARAYIISGEPERAIKELESVLASGDEENARVLLILAHLRAGDNAKATSVASSMAREHPNDPRILTIAGNVYLAVGDAEKARRYFDTALSLAPDFLPAAMAVARVYENDGEFSRARSEYEALIAKARQKVIPMLALASLEERQGQIDRMVYWLTEATALNPPQVSPRLMLANHYLSQQKPDEARALVDEALQIDPRNLSGRLLQVRVLMTEQRYSQALPLLTELAESRPESIPVSLLLAESYLRQERVQEALDVSRRIIQKQPNSIPANMLMAAAEMNRSRYPQALEHAEKLTRLKPDWYKGYEMTGDVKTAMQDYAGALSAYEKALELEPRRELVIKTAQTHMYAGRAKQAEEQLENWINRNGEDEQSLLLLGIIYQRQDRHEAAVAAYEKVLSRDTDNPIALNNLAGLYDLSGDPRALAVGERAYRSHPGAPDIQDTYGWLQTKYGEPDKGRRLLEKALQQLPGNPDIRYHLAVALYRSGNEQRAKTMLAELLSEQAAFTSKSEAVELFNKIRGQ